MNEDNKSYRSYHGQKREGVVIKVITLKKSKKNQRKTERLTIEEVFLGKTRITGFSKKRKNNLLLQSPFREPFNIFTYINEIKGGEKIHCLGPYKKMGNSTKEDFKNFMKKHNLKKGFEYRVIKVIHGDY